MALFQPSQGCALRKIEGNPLLWNCKILGVQYMICMKKVRFSNRSRAKVRCQGPPGSAKARPCMFFLVYQLTKTKSRSINTRKWKRSTFRFLDKVAIKRTFSWRARLARSGSQSGPTIQFVLPPRGFSRLLIRGL